MGSHTDIFQGVSRGYKGPNPGGGRGGPGHCYVIKSCAFELARDVVPSL